MRTLPALLLALFAATAFAQGAYRWVDKDGKVHYSDEPPPADARKAEQKSLVPSVVDSGGKLSYEARQAATAFPVTLYVSPDCGAACDTARAFLNKRGVPYTEKRIVTAEDFAALKKSADSDTVPTLTVGRQVGKGFEQTAWGGLLDSAGYPPATD